MSQIQPESSQDLRPVMRGEPKTLAGRVVAITGGARGIRRATAEAPHVAALERPRFEVWVPRSSQSAATVASVFPRGVRERILRALRADQVLLKPDVDARAA